MNDILSLTERIKASDRAAFDELYKQHYLSLRSYARLLLGVEEADDVVQDVFFNLWIHRDTLDASLSIRSYLLRSVYNSALNLLKRKKYQENYDNSYRQEIEEMGYTYYNPDSNDIIQRLYNQDMRAEIHTAIDALSPRSKEVFILSYLYDMSSKEISSKLGISLSTVENHIYSALKLLRKKLSIHKKDLFLLFLFCKITEFFSSF